MANIRHRRVCIICGKEYEYCSHCGEYNPKETWRYNYCSHDCKNIFEICSQYSFGYIKAKDALGEIKKCDLSRIADFNKGIMRDINRMKTEVNDS